MIPGEKQDREFDKIPQHLGEVTMHRQFELPPIKKVM